MVSAPNDRSRSIDIGFDVGGKFLRRTADRGKPEHREAFLRLRKASALPVAYAQLVSMGRLSVLEKLITIRSQLAQVQLAKPVAPLSKSVQDIFLSSDNDSIRFD